MVQPVEIYMQPEVGNAVRGEEKLAKGWGLLTK